MLIQLLLAIRLITLNDLNVFQPGSLGIPWLGVPIPSQAANPRRRAIVNTGSTKFERIRQGFLESSAGGRTFR
jgi:hypothetical protein